MISCTSNKAFFAQTCLESMAYAHRQVFIGVPQSEVPGSTCKEQRAALDKMSWEQFLELAQAKGFVYKSTVGSCIVLPPQYMMLNASLTQSCHGVRWQLFGSCLSTQLTQTLMSKAIAENASLKRHSLVKDAADKLLAKAKADSS